MIRIAKRIANNARIMVKNYYIGKRIDALKEYSHVPGITKKIIELANELGK